MVVEGLALEGLAAAEGLAVEGLAAAEGLAVEGLAAAEGLAVEGYRQLERGVGRPNNCAKCSAHLTAVCSPQRAQYWLMIVLDQRIAADKLHATPFGMTHLGGGRLGGGGLQAPEKLLSWKESPQKRTATQGLLVHCTEMPSRTRETGLGVVIACAYNMACRRDQGPQQRWESLLAISY